ncbi:chorismate mutase [Thalassobacillus sp. CUG 92003]|uniref:chorismate mutase n=1 Tax=Thalassobacillus sp. CUG 92003 TaxID=2736641 RepID=UPI0015E795B2
MIRGIRGATTVDHNEAAEIIARSQALIEDIIHDNHVEAENVASVMFSATVDIDAAFPAKALRHVPGWTYVPVMCMQEIPVPDSLPLCIRVMVTVETELDQPEVRHIYHHNAKQLRPDLNAGRGGSS